jgi:Na+/proline symporter
MRNRDEDEDEYEYEEETSDTGKAVIGVIGAATYFVGAILLLFLVMGALLWFRADTKTWLAVMGFSVCVLWELPTFLDFNDKDK